MDDFLLPLNASGTPPESRIKDAKAAHAIYENFRSADFAASVDRALVQDVLDGAAPIPPEALKALGQSYRANLNWGEGKADHQAALAAYNDLVTGVDRLYNVQTSYGDANQQQEFNEKIATAYHDFLTGWEEFHFNHLLNAHFFVSQGISVLTFADPRTWKYKISSIDDFKIPRDQWACDSQIDVAVARRTFRTGDLYRYLTNAKAAKELGKETGWNTKLLTKVLSKQLGQDLETDPEEIQRAFKNNDLYQSYKSSIAGNVRVLMYFVREFDGTYSRFIALRDGSEDEFLYEKVGEFGTANQAFIVFPYGVGSNGCFHSIRGMSQENFAHIQSSNRLRNAALDGALIRATLLCQGGSASDREALTLAYAGPLSMLPAGVVPTAVQMPNLANELMPIIRDMSILRKSNNGGYLAHVLSPEGGDRTAYEVQAQIAQSNILSSASLDLFYEPHRKMGKEVFRRLQRDDWSMNEDGGQEALEFRKTLAKQGVPWEAVQSVYKVTPVRAVGYGSPAARVAAYNRLLQIAPQMDPIGQGNLVRDIVTQTVGPGMADRYKPKGPDRLGVSGKIAELENDSMQSGRGVSVLPDEDHFVHGLVHTKDGEQFLQALEAGQLDPRIALKYFILQVPHTGTHLGYLSDKDLRAPQIQAMRKTLGQMNEVMQGLAKQAAAGNFDQQQQQQEPQAPQEDPETSMKMERHKLEMAQMVEEHQVKMGIMQDDAKQQLAIRDAEAAQTQAQNLNRPQPFLANSAGVAPTPRTTAEITAANQ